MEVTIIQHALRSPKSQITLHIIWTLCSDYMEGASPEISAYNDFMELLTTATTQSRTVYRMFESRTTNDVEYRCLRAVRRYAERRTRETDARGNIRNARNKRNTASADILTV